MLASLRQSRPAGIRVNPARSPRCKPTIEFHRNTKPPRLRLSSHSALPIAIDASAVTLLEPTRKDSKLPVLKKPRGKFFDADSLGAPIPSGMSQSKSTQHHAILFLDIDGVLNTTSTMLAHPGALRFAPSAVAALKEILSATDCRIVLISTRRRNGLEPIRQAFLANGLPEGAERLIDSTPILSDSDTDSLRAEEIQSWLEENHFTGPFAILDDGPIYGLPVITTSHDLGLTLRDADRAIQRLG